MFVRLIACVLVAAAAAAPAAAQQFDRRARDEPEVSVEAGGRVGTADVVRFSPDGQYLLAAGDDKVVRLWPHSADGLDAGRGRTLRWRSWRDQLGGIKAVAVSPDGRRVAVGGFGLKVSAVALLDRDTGDTLAITWPRAPEGVAHHDAVMAVAFHPDGRRIGFGTADGTLWLWEPKKLDKPDGERAWNAPVRAGRFDRDPGSEFALPRGIHFPDADTLVAVSARGQVLACALRAKLSDDPAAPVPGGVTLFHTHAGVPGKPGVDKAAWTGDGRWLAAATTGPLVLLRSMDGKRTVRLELPPDHFPRSLAVHPKTGTLAVGVASAHPPAPGKPRFYAERDDELWVYDDPLAENPKPRKLPHPGRAEALGFHPTDDRLAVAGGDADEVTLLDLAAANPAKPVSVVRGAGRRLYAVNLSENGGVIGVRTGRDPAATDPNDRGAGPWVKFDVARFTPTAEEPRWVGVVTAADGWEIVPDPKSRFIWHAARLRPGGGRESYRLQLDPDADQSPTCFTFLPAAPNAFTRVLVGHYYGCSLFELDPDRAVKNPATGEAELPRSKLYVGHGAEVNSVVADRTGTWFVTAGADQTVAAWSLADWPSEPSLGAAFAVDGAGLVVKAVDVGSPAWEAGLSQGDRVDRLAVAGKLLYDGRPGKAAGTAKQALAALARPQSGVELFFGWQPAGSDDRRATPTRLKQRPLWKWFPAFDDRGRLTDSVAWMWHGSFYHTASVHGDRLVGWHVNDADAAKSPDFHPLERYRHLFQRPDVMGRLIESRSVADALKVAWGDNPARRSFRQVEAAPVDLALKQTTVRGEGVALALAVNPRGSNPDFLPERVELWVNDYRFRTWAGKGKESLAAEVVIPAAAFRTGDNRVTLLAVNPARGRSEVARVVTNPAKPADPTLYGLAVGIDDYSAHRKAVAGPRAFADLGKARADATGVARTFLAYRGPGKCFPAGGLTVLLDAEAGRAGLTAALAGLKDAKVKPDDLLVVFLAGHGDLLTAEGKPLPADPKARGLAAESGRFVFCCPDYAPPRFAATALPAEELFEALAGVNCRKLVLLDACHAGGAAEANLLRRLVPDGQGPVVIAACDRGEVSFEDAAAGHGVFTRAVLEALGDRFRAADADSDGVLTAAELYAYVADRVPALARKLRPDASQHPICFPHPGALPHLPLVRR